MKKINLLALMLLCSVVSAFAKADVTAKVEIVPNHPDRFNIVVSMTNAENEVRGLECQFTLPEGVNPMGVPSYNEDRFDGFVPTLAVNPAGSLSKVTFLSLSGDYVQGTEGEVFRFTVQADEETLEAGFVLSAEVSYDNAQVDNIVVPVSFSEASPYKMSVEQTKVSVEEGEAVISLSLDNEQALGGFELVVELPEGVEFVTKSNGKVNWTFSSRVAQSKTVSENKLADGKVKLMLIDAMSDNLVQEGHGELVSFKVKAAEGKTIAEDSYITISNIKFSKVNGKQFNQESALLVEVEGAEAIAVVPGDVNNDGVINGADMVTLREIILHDGYDTTGLYPDVNGDGSVNGADMVELREIILHQ